MQREKTIRCLALGLVILTLFSASASAAEWKRGIIADMDGGRIMLINLNETIVFAHSSSTLVSLNGRPARATDLRIGDGVLVMYLYQGVNMQRAQRIEAFRQAY